MSPELPKEKEDDISKKPSEGDKKVRQGCMWGAGCLAVLICLSLLLRILGFGGKETESAKLGASASFTGTQVVITNRDPFDWLDVKVAIDGGVVLADGYVLEIVRIRSGETCQLGLVNFTKDGARFNPFARVPRNILISATTPSGRAIWIGGQW